MRTRATVSRILRVTAISLCAVLLLCFAFIQLEQHLLRRRAERLLADFHAIRLKQSTWADAQRLMSLWGRWGHYEGTCTSTDCSYIIRLTNEPPPRLVAPLSEHAERFLLALVRVFNLLGGKFASMQVSFLVQDGLIQRSSVGLSIEVPPHQAKEDEYGYVLLLSARASQSLHERQGGPWILGTDEQLAQHPYYKAGRPGGCEICLRGDVTFTPFASPAEVRYITSYDLSCLTRSRFCLTLPDVLPAAREWHLYPSVEREPEPPAPTGPPAPCDIPIFALARDATQVLEVRVLSRKIAHEAPSAGYPSGRDFERAAVEVLSTLKGDSGPSRGSMSLEPYAYDFNFPQEASETLLPGQLYFVFLNTGPGFPEPHMDRCGEVPDTPESHAQVETGLSQNDELRRNQKFGDLRW